MPTEEILERLAQIQEQIRRVQVSAADTRMRELILGLSVADLTLSRSAIEATLRAFLPKRRKLLSALFRDKLEGRPDAARQVLSPPETPRDIPLQTHLEETARMHLLVRKISSYTGTDILLGVFPTAQQADAARSAYVARYVAAPAADPWREQAYREPGLQAGDLVVMEMALFGAAESADVFVVSRCSEGFGQTLRDFDSLHGSEDAAKARLSELDAQERSFPESAQCQRVRVAALLSDAPEDQPQIG